MSEIILKIPCAQYAEQIMAYRREFLESGSEFDGCSGLRKFESAEAWLTSIRQKKTIRHSVPKSMPLARSILL